MLPLFRSSRPSSKVNKPDSRRRKRQRGHRTLPQSLWQSTSFSGSGTLLAIGKCSKDSVL